MARLPSQSGPLPVLLVQGEGDPTGIAIGQIETPIEVVGRATAFAGVSSDDPVLVVDARSLERRLGDSGNPLLRPGARTEYWIAGPTDEALAAVGELEAFPLGDAHRGRGEGRALHRGFDRHVLDAQRPGAGRGGRS